MPLSDQLWVIDQIADGWVSVEIDGVLQRIPLWFLPNGGQEGDVYRVRHEMAGDRSVLTIVADPAERARRIAASRVQVATRSPNDPGGDIVL